MSGCQGSLVNEGMTQDELVNVLPHSRNLVVSCGFHVNSDDIFGSGRPNEHAQVKIWVLFVQILNERLQLIRFLVDLSPFICGNGKPIFDFEFVSQTLFGSKNVVELVPRHLQEFKVDLNLEEVENSVASDVVGKTGKILGKVEVFGGWCLSKLGKKGVLENEGSMAVGLKVDSNVKLIGFSVGVFDASWSDKIGDATGLEEIGQSKVGIGSHDCPESERDGGEVLLHELLDANDQQSRLFVAVDALGHPIVGQIPKVN